MPEELQRIRQFMMTAEFIRAAIKLSAAEARRVWNTLDLLSRDPNRPGLNLENLVGACGLQSARVNDRLRIILSGGTPPVLEFVGGHDEAYRFAERLTAAVPAQDLRRVPLHLFVPRHHPVELLGLPEQPMQVVDRERPFPEVRELSLAIQPSTVKNLLTRSKKYLPLMHHLLSRRRGHDSLVLDFTAIERVIAATLPMSARAYRAWWANDSTHVQATAWLAAGWQTTEVDMRQQKVKFMRSTT